MVIGEGDLRGSLVSFAVLETKNKIKVWTVLYSIQNKMRKIILGCSHGGKGCGVDFVPQSHFFFNTRISNEEVLS